MRTEYKFFDDHVEIDERILIKRKSVITFNYVEEVDVSVSTSQKKYGLGTIELITSGFVYITMKTGGYWATHAIHITDIPNPEENHQRIKALVQRGTNASASGGQSQM